MKITKIGHSCLLVQENGVRILTDPGSFSQMQDELTDLDLILITHADMDHLSLTSLKKILENNPNVGIITNSEVGEVLKKEGIEHIKVEDSEKSELKGILIEGFGKLHELIYESIPRKANTGYLINSKLFIPGDSFTIPTKPVEILAINVYAPWLKFSEAIEYAKIIKPKICIPIHDGVLKESFTFTGRMFPIALEPLGIKFVNMKIGNEYEF